MPGCKLTHVPVVCGCLSAVAVILALP